MKVLEKSELQSPVKLPLMAIKSPFVGALTASGKLHRPNPSLAAGNDRFLREYYLINNNLREQLSGVHLLTGNAKQW